MRFSKWYQDCITDAGDVFIGYKALLRMRGLTVQYAQRLTRPRDGPTEQTLSLRPTPAPESDNRNLTWFCDRLGVRGHWAALVPPYSRILFSSPDGEIRWHCKFPCARAHVSHHDGREMSGLGYAEYLEMTLPPWRIPIAELRWGRFLSTDDTVTWIEWRGPIPRRWIFHNGAELEDATVGESQIHLGHHRGVLTLDSSVILRSGAFTDSALRPLRTVRCLLPRGISNGEETKWRARGTLTGPERSSTGWVIHETVRWT